MTNFDPYQRWLGIPLEDQPPHLYRLLGIELFEEDSEIIKAAAENSIAFIQQNAFGVELQQSQRVLKELAVASQYLQSPENKAKYDRKLKIKLGLVKPETTTTENSQRKTKSRASDQNKHEQVNIPDSAEPNKLNLLGLQISYLWAGVSVVIFLSLIVSVSMMFTGDDVEVESPVQTASNEQPAETVEATSHAKSKRKISSTSKKGENPRSPKPVTALPQPVVPLPLPAEEFTGQFTVRTDSLNNKPGKELQDVVVEVIYQPGRKKSERVLLGTVTTDEKGQAQFQVKLTPQEQTGRFLVKLTRENTTWERKLNNFPNELTQTLAIPVVSAPEYLNPTWIEQRLEQVGIDKLIQEYRTVNDPLVQLVYSTLDLSQHILRDHPEALREQLQARLLNRREPELDAFQTLPEQQIYFRSEWPSINQVGGSLLRTIGSHSGDVNCLAVTSDGKHVISGGDDRLIKVWDLSSQTLVSTLKGHKRQVYCLSLTPDGKQIISGSNDRTIKVWDFKSGKLLQTLKGHTSSVLHLGVSPDGKIAVSTSHDKQLIFWDITTGKKIRSISAKKYNFGSVTIPSNGNRILTGLGTSLVSYNLETGRKSGTIRSENYELNQIATTPDGKYAITSMNPPRVWDLNSGKVIRTFEKYPGNISCMTVSPDGNQVIAGTNEREVVIWNFSSGNLARVFNGHLDRVTSLAVSPDGRYLISGSNDTTLKLWNLRNSIQSPSIEKHAREVKSIVISEDGRQAVSGDDYELKIWNLSENILIRAIKIKNHNSMEWLSYLPDEKFAISGTYSRFTGWDLSTGNEVQSFYSGTGIGKLAVTPDGTCGITTTPIREKNRVTATKISVWDLAKRKLKHSFTSDQGYVYCLDISADGKQLYTGSRNVFSVWNLDNGTLVHSYKEQVGDVRHLALSRDGKGAITSAVKNKRYDIKVWDLTNQKLLHSLQGHERDITCLAVSPNGKQAVSGASDQTLNLWDLTEGKLLATHVLDDAPRAIAIGPDGKTLMVGGLSGRVHKLRIIMPGEKVQQKPGSGSVSGLVVKNTAQKRQSETAKQLGHKVKIINSLDMHFAFIPAGKFLMGSRIPAIEIAKQFDSKSSHFLNEHPQHEVQISKPFYMGMHEVTIDEFKQFVKMTDYKTESERSGKGGAGWDEKTQKFRFGIPGFDWAKTGWLKSDFHPVVNVSWNDAANFCKWLSIRTKEKYRLPTEAEWEYVCRAGSTSLYYHGDDAESLAQFGNIWDGSANQQFQKNYAQLKGISALDGFAFTAPVGTYEANAWSIYDMHGNVMEWCSDWHDDDYYKNLEGKISSDPQGSGSGSSRMLRGGNWSLFPQYARSAYRTKLSPANYSSSIGFRVVLEIE